MEDISSDMSKNSIKINDAQRSIRLLKPSNQDINKKYKYTLGGDNELIDVSKEIDDVRDNIN